jgi:hypothetical protein
MLLVLHGLMAVAPLKPGLRGGLDVEVGGFSTV